MPSTILTRPFTTTFTSPFTSPFTSMQMAEDGTQNGVITISSGSTSATATLESTVDVTRTMLLFNGFNTDNTTADMASDLPRITLTDGNTVTATRGGTTGNVVVRFSLIQLPTTMLSATVQYHTITIGPSRS